MLRKLVTATVMAALISIQGAYALGLGEIHLNSALNQQLDADIGLFSSRPGELTNAEVKLATQAAFDRAGIERLPLLFKLRFKLEGVEEGKPVIKVSSADTIDEPFLNFLVELNWSNGRLLREYTLLLDPPSLMPEPAPVVETPEVEATPVVPEPIVATPIEPAQAAEGATEYGPTRRNETLWEIASQVRPDNSISIHQMMQVLLRENPEAFHRNNINNLKVGYILRVPDRETIESSISAEEARAASRRQNQAWREGRTTVAQPVAKSQPAQPEVAEPTASVSSEPSEGRLKIVAPTSEVAGSETASQGADTGKEVAGDIEGLKRELNLLAETNEAQRQENSELRSRLDELQQQLETASRLLQLKDDELAALQARASEAAVPAPIEAAPVQEAAVPAPEAAAPAAEPPKPAPVVIEAPKPAPVTIPEPVEEEQDFVGQALEFVDDMLDEPLLLGGAAAVLVLLAVVVWLAMRRRRMGMTEFQESILAASPKPTGFSDISIDKTPSGDEEGGSYDQTNLSDFGSISGMGDIQTEVSEVDPIAEADVYIAYGRFQQAEDMLKEAVQNEPERNDLKLKLLEVYKATKNNKAFENDAEALYAALGGQSDPVWDRVVAMGKEMGIDNPIFSLGDEPTTDDLSAELNQIMQGDSAAQELDTELSDTEADSVLGSDEALDLDFDLGDMAPAGEASATSDEGEFSFDLDETAPQLEPETAAQPEAAGEEEFSFDLGESVPQVEPEVAEQPEAASEEAFSFDLAEMPESSPEAEPVPELEMVDLGGLDLEAATTEEPAAPEFEMGELEIGELELPEEAVEEALPSFGLDEAAEEPAEEGDELLGGLDEVGTKLDLAKAYIDMGDPDGARSILNEVMAEGSEAQKGEAEALLQQLG